MRAILSAIETPAFRLLAACVDWRPKAAPDEARNAAIRAAAEVLGGDWSGFLELVARHRIAPLALDGLSAAGVDAPDALLHRAQHDKKQAMLIAVEARHLLALLTSAGIEAMMLKGPLVSQQIFGDPAMRQCADLDLLVPEAEMAQARVLIGGQGYRLQGAEPPWSDAARMRYWRIGAKDITLTGGKRRIAVELHYRLKTAAGLIPRLGLYQARHQVTLAGTPMRTFGEADLFAYLTVHGATSLWNRLKWLADIRAMLSGKSEAEIAELLDHARSLGVARCAALAMLLCERVWGQALPRQILALRETDSKLALLEARSLQAMGDPDAKMGSLGGKRLATTAFRLRDDVPYYRSVLASMLVDPQIVATLKLPKGLGFLYIPARLFSWGRSRIKSD